MGHGRCVRGMAHAGPTDTDRPHDWRSSVISIRSALRWVPATGVARRLAVLITCVLLAGHGRAWAQGPLTNGGMHSGTIGSSGEVDSWSFHASIDDNLNLAIGEVEPTSGFSPWIRLFAPGGQMVAQSSGPLAAQLNNIVAPENGTYTVLVSSDATASTGTGGYALSLVAVPGSYTTSSGDQGEAMTNGANYSGVITLGDLDVWTFTANAGDLLNAAIGEVEPTVGFSPWIRLFGPDGALLWSTTHPVADQVHDIVAPASGTYSLLVASYADQAAGTGGYTLTVANTPGSFVVSSGDQGGSASTTTVNNGVITRADLDSWTFVVATAGHRITASISEIEPTDNFSPWIRLIDPAGNVIAQAAGTENAQVNNVVAPVPGTYTVLVSSYLFVPDGTGSYALGITHGPARLPDLTLDFGPAIGLWGAYNPAGQPPRAPAWEKLHGLSPTVTGAGLIDANDRGDRIMVFPGFGTWALLNNVSWVRLHPFDATIVVTADLDHNGVDDVILNFPGYGVWVRYDGGAWVHLHGFDATAIAAGQLDGGTQVDLVVSFPGYGVWTYWNSLTWTNLNPQDASDIKIANLDADPLDEVIINTASGLWIRPNNSEWRRLHPISSDGMVIGNLDGDPGQRRDVLINFPGFGVYLFLNGTSWVKIHGFNAPRAVASDLDQNGIDDLILNFTGYGVWTVMNGTTWARLHPFDAEAIVAGNFDGN